MYGEYLVSERILYHRVKEGLTQSEVAQKVREYDSESKISAAQLSLWENGQKGCPYIYAGALAKVFNVTPEYLLGKDLIEKQEELAKKLRPMASHDMVNGGILEPTNRQDLRKYNGCPVYIKYPEQYKAYNGWGINICAQHKIWFKTYELDYDHSLLMDNVDKSKQAKLYILSSAYSVDYEVDGLPLKLASMRDILESKRVFVVTFTCQSRVRNFVSGWYENDRYGGGIRNEQMFLPYEGLGVSYRAYIEGR